MGRQLSPLGKALLVVGLVLALISIAWPSRPVDTSDSSLVACPLGYTSSSDMQLPLGHPSVLGMDRQNANSAHPGGVRLELWHNGTMQEEDLPAAEAILVNTLNGKVIGRGTMQAMQALASSAQECILHDLHGQPMDFHRLHDRASQETPLPPEFAGPV
mmetsp:Transcript_9000/g.15638  ORF Transcript_9000/g.15638 Transcript_9000/m.15638 type:complete len:159 (+) Transcript_9000:134-610(+)